MFQGMLTFVLFIVVVVLLLKLWGWFFRPEKSEITEEPEADDYSSEELDIVIKKKTHKLNELKAMMAQLEAETNVTSELITVTESVEKLTEELNEVESKLKTDQNEQE